MTHELLSFSLSGIFSMSSTAVGMSYRAHDENDDIVNDQDESFLSFSLSSILYSHLGKH